MSNASPTTTLRIPVAIEAQMEAAIDSANYHSRIEPYTKSSWILHAIREKLAKIQRGKKGKKNAPANNANLG